MPSDRQLDRLDEWVAEKMRIELVSGHRPVDGGHGWYSPTRDANAAAELRKAMASDGSTTVFVTWSPVLPDRFVMVQAGSVGEEHSSENIATVRCFIRYHGGNPDEIMGEA